LSPLLQLQDLQTVFATPSGRVKAVDGVSLQLDAGRVLGLVGESGCGKSVTALSIMRLVPQPSGSIVSGRILFNGLDLLAIPESRMRRLRGNEISMIFQEPMTSLNPVFTIGEQIAEVVSPAPGNEPRRFADSGDGHDPPDGHPRGRTSAPGNIRIR
jgi:peptide/nickel transport system ATP-binding protein/oligopeptide transport system ATP-binding protein